MNKYNTQIAVEATEVITKRAIESTLALLRADLELARKKSADAESALLAEDYEQAEQAARQALGWMEAGCAQFNARMTEYIKHLKKQLRK